MSESSSGVVSLEELFLAREFGRETGRHLRAVEEVLGEAPEARELEDLFLSRDFGRPVALRLVEGDARSGAGHPNVVEFPFGGPGAKAWDQPARQRAVAALSGVAAAAIILTGLASATGHSGQPAVSAFSHAPTLSGPPAGGLRGGATAPGASALGGARASTGTPGADITANSSLGTGGAVVPSVGFAVQQVPPASSTTGFPSGADAGLGPAGQPPAPPPPAPAPSSTSIPAVTTVVGDEVSQAGTTVAATTGNLGTMLPGSGSLAATMTRAGTGLSVVGESIASAGG